MGRSRLGSLDNQSRSLARNRTHNRPTIDENFTLNAFSGHFHGLRVAEINQWTNNILFVGGVECIQKWRSNLIFCTGYCTN